MLIFAAQITAGFGRGVATKKAMALLGFKVRRKKHIGLLLGCLGCLLKDCSFVISVMFRLVATRRIFSLELILIIRKMLLVKVGQHRVTAIVRGRSRGASPEGNPTTCEKTLG